MKKEWLYFMIGLVLGFIAGILFYHFVLKKILARGLKLTFRKKESVKSLRIV